MTESVSAHDVTAYILNRQGPMSAMKLQKLIYYAQAWALVWDESPLFSERIEAWANGPVVRGVYGHHRGTFEVRPPWSLGDPDRLAPQQRETIDSVLNFYGDKSAQWLSDLTHQERPWLEARSGLAPGERGDTEISLASMHEYYGSLHAK